MNSESIDLEFSTPTKYKNAKTYERSKTAGCVELIFPSPSKDITNSPNSSINISDIIDMPSPTLKRKQKNDINTPRKKKLQNIITRKQQQINSKKTHIFKLKKKINSLKTRNCLNNLIMSHKFPSTNSRAIVTMQLKNKRRPWTTEERKLALTMFYKSPSSYNFLRLQNLNLPGPSTVRGWIGQSKFLPGINKKFFAHLKHKFEFKEYKEKACSVCIDEISIKEFLEYSKDFDFIEGFEDLGKHGRSCNTANSCLVFMARGIYDSWKIPVAYFVTHSSIKHGILKSLIVDVVQELFNVSLCPKIIICDQGTNNQSAFKSLNVSEEKPYFYVDEHKVFAIFDTPHLLKSVRNNLIGNTFRKGDKIIAFSDILSAYNIDVKNKKSRALLKITDAHVKPNSFQKMSVKLAAQIFSHSMASAIRTCISTSELKSNTASDTADFIDFMDKLFDCLNSRNLFSKNPYNCALTDFGVVKSFLLNAANYFNDIFKVSYKGKETRPPCFNGFTQTINGVLCFFDEELKNNGITFLITNRLNQDVLENLFSIFRQKGGYNKNPTVRIIRTSFRSTCVFSLIASKGSNCMISQEIDDSTTEQDVISVNRALDEVSDISDTSDTSSNCSSSSSSIKSVPDPDIIKPNDITIEDCSVTYFSGYLAYKCDKKFNCNDCNTHLTTKRDLNDKNQLLLVHKNYSDIDKDTGLKAPSVELKNVIDHALEIFEKKFEKIQHTKKLKLKFLTIYKTDKLISRWINKEHTCVEHHIFILEKLLICKIFKKAKLFSTTSHQSKIAKLKILNHI